MMSCMRPRQEGAVWWPLQLRKRRAEKSLVMIWLYKPKAGFQSPFIGSQDSKVIRTPQSWKNHVFRLKHKNLWYCDHHHVYLFLDNPVEQLKRNPHFRAGDMVLWLRKRNCSFRRAGVLCPVLLGSSMIWYLHLYAWYIPSSDSWCPLLTSMVIDTHTEITFLESGRHHSSSHHLTVCGTPSFPTHTALAIVLYWGICFPWAGKYACVFIPIHPFLLISQKYEHAYHPPTVSSFSHCPGITITHTNFASGEERLRCRPGVILGRRGWHAEPPPPPPAPLPPGSRRLSACSDLL